MKRGSRVSINLRMPCSPLWQGVPLITLAAIALAVTSGFGQARLGVPDVRFHTYPQAQCILGLHGLNIRLSGVSRAAGTPVVVRQEPEAGAQLVQGDAVVVTLGPSSIPTRQLEVTVPRLPAGTQIDAARIVLQKQDLCAATDPPGVRTGSVMNQNPSGGTPVPRGTTITLKIGEAPSGSRPTPSPGNTGEPPSLSLVPQFRETPNVVGRPLPDAVRILTAAGFAVGNVKRVVSNETPGTVIEQAPAPGTPALLRTAVALAVAGFPQSRAVPDVVGRSLDDARRILAESGFALGRVTKAASDETPGTVTAQSPEGGTPASPKTLIVLTIAIPQPLPRVPDVVGRSLDDARRILSEAGFGIGRVTRAPSSETAGTVTAQSPEGGTPAPLKSLIAVMVAVPQPLPRVPDVVGRSLDDARRILSEAGFGIGRVTRAPSNETAGTVTAQTPAGGTPEPPRTGIDLTIAIPMPEVKARVPNVVGRPLDDAARVLADAGFAVGRITEEVSNETTGTVTAQSPEGGTPAPPKTAVAVTVAMPQPLARVPNVVGRSLAEAVRMLTEAGFTVGGVTRTPSTEAAETVTEQAPRGDTLAPPKAVIALGVAIPQPPAHVPDVVGRPLDGARRTLAAAGFAVGRVTRAASDKTPGIVTSQAPLGGAAVVRPLPAVNLTLAAVRVPDVVGQLFDPAETALARARFTVQATLQPSDKPRGTVIYQDPVAGALVIPPLPVVKLTLAAAEVPSVVGRSLGVATRTLGDAGFASVASGWPQIAFARVVDQKPVGGTFVASAQAVVALTVRTDAGQWLLIIGGSLLMVGGSIAVSKVRTGPRSAPRLIRMNPRRDLGVQEIQLGGRAARGESGILKDTDVRLRPVSDPGSPEIDRPDDVLTAKEGNDHA